jgi:hypothetical protein
MTKAELEADLALCSPFYAEQFRKRRKKWAAEDRTDALNDLKFYRAMKKDVQADARLNELDLSRLVAELNKLIANRIQFVSKVVMS